MEFQVKPEHRYIPRNSENPKKISCGRRQNRSDSAKWKMSVSTAKTLQSKSPYGACRKTPAGELGGIKDVQKVFRVSRVYWS
ncbi:hypothetical protein TNIN_6821 [Trichonephila inaurata madagascariensis]|uniref:Uncharacterized protein n=1 Tax=Trichonephila inaurata madagascariensis TaxID=2747483 RepID=A0A8X6WW47_9ARAC|nr:hypothetical protein TNIN_428391 [Trichonephila inaurata madagascariensis]GFY62373.1 hypothetical protein TNIN_6821 [Trichonephila inaurata madagascariensis]